MGNENRLYSISLGVASLQGGLVGVATALSPATCRPFQVFSPSFFVGLELTVPPMELRRSNRLLSVGKMIIATTFLHRSGLRASQRTLRLDLQAAPKRQTFARQIYLSNRDDSSS